MSQTSPVTETVKLLRRRAAGFMARDMSIFNGRIIAEELKEIAREVEAMAARSSDHAQRQQEWQPIETAPHETRVLLGWIYDGQWFCETGMASHGWRRNGVSNMSRHGHATHWQPLPAALTDSSTDRPEEITKAEMDAIEAAAIAGKPLTSTDHRVTSSSGCVFCDIGVTLHHDDVSGFHHVAGGETIACSLSSPLRQGDSK